MAGARAATVRNLKVLKMPQKGGTKKEYEDFLDKIHNHVVGMDNTPSTFRKP